MSLNLPESFRADLEGKDTNLIPVVILFNDSLQINISTNSIEFATFSFKPLLLNIPSLKESIDIEKRNYKISSVNLDISNLPYEGSRFSELVGDNSLINTGVNIYWISPSIINDPLSAAFQVYTGSIRRYSHDDEKVRLVVEDRSQATLHKDLPLEILDPNDPEVPDKYKNKPIPMVYGHVDRSPCVIKSSPIVDEWGIGSGDIDIYPDSVAPLSIDGRFVYYGGKYLSILTSMTMYNMYNPNGFTIQEDFIYNQDDSAQIIDINITDFIRLISLGSNAIMKNILPIVEISDLSDVNIKPLREKTHDFDAGLIFGNESNINYTSVYNKDTQEVFGTFVRDSSGGVGAWDGASLLENLVGTDNDIFPDLQTTTYIDRAFPACLVETNLSEGKFISNFASITTDIDPYYGSVAESGGAHSIYLSIKSGSKTQIKGGSEGFSQTGDEWFDINVEHEQETWVWSTALADYADGVKADRLTIALWSTGTSAGVICATKFKINRLTVRRYGLIEGVIDNDFYANVNGRAMDNGFSPTAPSAIVDILNTELEQNVTADGDGYGDWKYAFTVDKKINSKKLIENIASASPFIPRFRMGEFKFDTIPLTGGNLPIIGYQEDGTTPIYSENHTIKKADCIDFSFSRSKIESVFSKIILKYNWDYARGEFNDSVESDVLILGDDYNFDYYGLPNDHSESTLTIDGEQGKYIRTEETARNFADWFLLWSCNQKLEMKVRLPLKYMNLEIGDLVKFDDLLGGIKPYGIDYVNNDESNWLINGQQYYRNFLIVSTNKTLDFVEIVCTQMHDLVGDCATDDLDCAGVCYGSAVVDDCGICGGDGGTEDCGCEDVPDGECDCFGNVVDFCGVCGGNNADLDCNGDCLGSAVVDDCGVCVEGDTGLEACDGDCAGVAGGTSTLDECGVCRETQPQDNDWNTTCDECTELTNDFDIPYNCGTPEGVNNPTGCYHYDICYGGEQLYQGTGDEGACSQIDDINDCAETYSGWQPPDIFMQTELKPFINRGYDTSLVDDDSVQTIELAIADLETLDGIDSDGDAITYYGIKSENLILNIINSLALDNNPSEAIWFVQYKITLTGSDYEFGMGAHPICGMPFIGGCPASPDIPLTILNEEEQTLSSEWIDYGEGVGYLDESDWDTDTQLDVWDGTSKHIFALDKGNLDAHFENYNYYAFDFIFSLKMNMWTELSDGTLLSDTYYIKEYSYRIFIGDCSAMADMNGDGGWNVLDVVILANCVLEQNCPDNCGEVDCYGCAGDMNGDGGYNVIDVVILSNCVLAADCAEHEGGGG